jgi:large subunit ribosomal protein L24
MKVHKNDQVLVIRGKDKGKRGKVLQVFPDRNAVTIESVNIVKRHMKQNPNLKQSGIIERPAPISAANVMVIAPSDNKPSRIGYKLVKTQEGGTARVKKVRICRTTQEELA